MLRFTHDFEKGRVSPEGCPFYTVHRSCQPSLSQRTTFEQSVTLENGYAGI